MLKDFDSEFTDLTDFILKITYRIWEERGVDRIREWYAPQAPVYTPLGVTRNVEDVVRFTQQTLQAFPDRKLYGEDVIGKSYRDGERELYYSSHRILSPMTHRGEGFFGKPTGRKTRTRTIADCVCEKNQVIEEWMVRDQGMIVKDLGLEVEDFGRKLGRTLAGEGKMLSPSDYVKRWQGGPSAGTIQGQAKIIRDMMHFVFTERIMEQLIETHDRAACCYVPQKGMLYGIDEIMGYLFDLANSFHNSVFQIHHWIELKEIEEPIRISLRWTLIGKHLGQGLYGTPSGAPLTLMGISHFELRRKKIYRAFHIFDELSIWAQIEVNASKANAIHNTK